MPQEDMGLQNDQSKVVENQPVQESGGDGAVAPGLDQELDNSLDNFFNNNEVPVVKQEVVKEAPKKQPENQVKPEVKTPKEEVKEKPEEVDVKAQEEFPEKPPKDQTAWQALKNKSKAAHKMIVDKDQEIARLKQTLAEKGNITSKETEGLKAQMEELKKFRAMVDLQADPEFVSKYDEPINGKLNTIKSMLKDMEVTDDVINQIDFTNTKLMDTILDHVGQHEDKFKARKLQRNIEEFIDLNDKKEETLLEHKTKYKDYLENKKKESFTKQSEEEGRSLKHIENLSVAKDVNNNPLYPFLAKVETGETTDPATLNKMNVHNNMVEQMQKKLNQLLNVQTPEERTEVAVAAVGAHYLSAQLKAVMKQNSALQAELKKISAVTTENEDPKPRRVASNGKQVSSDEALANFFANR